MPPAAATDNTCRQSRRFKVILLFSSYLQIGWIAGFKVKQKLLHDVASNQTPHVKKLARHAR